MTMEGDGTKEKAYLIWGTLNGGYV